MKTDRELLELAAKAAGLPYIKPLPEYSGSLGLEIGSNPMRTQTWSPLTDDGDALRLAVKLNLTTVFHPVLNQALCRPYCKTAMSDESREDGEKHPDPCAATRRAIVRAAAEIGAST